jgi:hypothetical protein
MTDQRGAFVTIVRATMYEVHEACIFCHMGTTVDLHPITQHQCESLGDVKELYRPRIVSH